MATVAAPEPTIYAYFDASTVDATFVLDDPARGMLDNFTYLLGGDTAVDITAQGFELTVRRGRSRELDEIETGTLTGALRNHLRIFDPTYGAYGSNIRPGKRVQVVVLGVTIFDGKIEDWFFDYAIDGSSTAALVAVDALGALGLAEFDAWTATAGQTAGQRIDAVLSRPEVGYIGGKALGVGSSLLQGDAVSWGSNVLNYCQLVAKSDNGRFFASRSNVLTFQGRNEVQSETVTVAFADDGSGVYFGGIKASFGGALLYTIVGIDREGGSKQTVTNSAGVALYGPRRYSIAGLLQDSDAQTLAMATYLAGKYSSATWRISEVTVDLSSCANSTQQAALVALDIGSVVSVKFTPNQIAGAVLQTCVVEGIEHLLGPKTHVVRVSLSTADEVPFTLDSVAFGQLDGVTLLGF